MQIRKRLQLNVFVTLVTALAICLMLFMALQRIKSVMELSAIANEIIRCSFERSTFREDYIRTNSERARIQWADRHEQISRLLQSARVKFGDAEDQTIIAELMKTQESIGKLFTAIVKNRLSPGSDPTAAANALMTENRLHTQIIMRTYDATLNASKLQDSGRRLLVSVLKNLGSGISIVLALVVVVLLYNSWRLNRSITERIRRLRDGAAMIGEGNLHHTIDLSGSDEFVELSEAFNTMTAKLRASYQDLETEIEERKRVEDSLHAKEADLRMAEQRVAERAAELQNANTLLRESRLAALNMMEDAVVARRIAEETSQKLLSEVNERKRAENALRESESQVRRKLDSILSPDGDLGNLELADIIDTESMQSLMENFYKLTKIPVGLIDLKGKVLVGAGWQDICTKFHRIHPEASLNCIESDSHLSAGIPPGEYRLYKCKNNMWDVATPIMVGGRHFGNIFIGQFFFTGETVDYELFRSQARRYGFPEDDYIVALDNAPRITRETLDAGMAYFMELADVISRMSYSNLKLARSLAERDSLMTSLRESEDRLNRAQEIANIGSWELDLVDNSLIWSDEVYRIFGLQPGEFKATYEAFLEMVYPDDRAAVDAAYADSLKEGRDSYEIEHRIVRKSTGEIRVIGEKCEHFKDQSGRIIRSIGMVQDITEQKQAAAALHKSSVRLDLLADTANQLLRSDSPQQVVDSLCQKMLAILDCHAFFNFLVDEDKGRLHLNACGGITEEEAKRIEWLDYGVAVCGCAAQDGCRIVAENIPETQDPRTDLVKSYGIQAYACHPLIVQGRVLGTLSFGTRTRTSFSDDDLSLMKALADQVAIAMERKRTEQVLRQAHDELEQKVRERTEELATTVETLLEEITSRERAEVSLQRLNRLYAVLSETGQTIVRTDNQQIIFDEICRIAVKHGGFRLAWIGLINAETGKVDFVAAAGETAYIEGLEISSLNEPGGRGPTGIVLRNGSYYICNNFRTDPCTEPWHGRAHSFGLMASATAAIKMSGKVIGALMLYADEEDYFAGDMVELLLQIAADISFALDNINSVTRRREAERALQEETLERLKTAEALREKEQLLIQQNRLAAMGEMINNIAHQWRQPLNTLGLTIQNSLLFYDTGDFNREFLKSNTDDAMKLIRHMSRTIDDFRNFFRSDKEKTTFKVRKAIQLTLSLIDNAMKNHNIKVVTHMEDDPLITGYFNEFSQALLNVLQNASDALVERKINGGEITIVATAENGRAVVTISDNAGGIPEEIIGRIFEPYFSTKGVQGTGIGLFMSKNIIEINMSGSITARNNSAGAEFRIEV